MCNAESSVWLTGMCLVCTEKRQEEEELAAQRRKQKEEAEKMAEERRKKDLLLSKMKEIDHKPDTRGSSGKKEYRWVYLQGLG